MLKYLFALLFGVCTLVGSAQPHKSKVIIYGNDAGAWAAAVQSARSGVETLWLRQQASVDLPITDNQRLQITTPNGMDAGIWAEFLTKTRGSSVPNDALIQLAKRDINTQIARNVLNSISDSLKNLHQLVNIEIQSIKKKGDQWQVSVSNRERLKVNALVDASGKNLLLPLVTSENFEIDSMQNASPIPVDQLYNNTLFRTSIFNAISGADVFAIPIQTLLSNPETNFFVLNHYPWLPEESQASANTLALRMMTGQALGASAAYCAFFKTTTNKINIRTLQGEILAYHGQIIPFQDISIQDPHFSAIQRIGATGLLKGHRKKSENTFSFEPEGTVSSKEIEPVILALYTRSQIWFNEKDIEQMTLSDLLSMIKFTALKGNELDEDVKKAWEKRFTFSGEFDPNAPINRRQLAVLIDYYLKPFHVTINREGKFRY